MDPFSISCTTCRAQLSVTSAKALGQILACPKCQSMVLVPDAAPSAESNPAQTTPTSIEMSGGLSDSFENIDSLLDDPVPSSPGVSSASPTVDRWRAPDHGPTEPSPEAEPTGEPASELTTGTFEAASTSTMLLRKYFLLVGSVVFGTIAAVGVIVISAGRGHDDIDVTQTDNHPTSPAVASANGGNVVDAALVETAPDSTENDTATKTSFVEDAPLPPTENVAGDPESDVVQVQQLPAEEPEKVTQPENEKLQDAENLNALPNESERPATAPAIGQDDELTNFVEWLKQDPHATPAAKPTVPLPASVEADPENTIAPIATTNRPEPPLVDVEAKLRDSVDAFSLEKTSLARALRAVQSVSTIPITVEPDALYIGKTTATSRISFLAKKRQTIDELLDGLLGAASKGKLAPTADNGHLTVTSNSLTRYSSRPHKIADLAANSTEAMELAAWIPHLVAPGTWQEDGGRATCTADPNSGELTVTHNLLNQYRVYRFLHRLRAARGLSHKKLANGQASLTPKPDRDSKLQTTVSVRLPRGATLPQIATELERQANVAVLIDWKSLHTAGWSPKDQLPFFCDNIPLAVALDQLLTPIGLAANIVDRSTIQIVYPLNDPSWDIEFYPLPAGRNEQSAADTVARVANVTGIPATSVWDKTSKRLIVAAPQSVHRRIMDALK